jgi:hypothetical protein
LWKSVTDNLDNVVKQIAGNTLMTDKAKTLAKIDSIHDAIDATAKTLRWILCSHVGESTIVF